jgi:hypothetical protein
LEKLMGSYDRLGTQVQVRGRYLVLRLLHSSSFSALFTLALYPVLSPRLCHYHLPSVSDYRAKLTVQGGQ